MSGDWNSDVCYSDLIRQNASNTIDANKIPWAKQCFFTTPLFVMGECLVSQWNWIDLFPTITVRLGGENYPLNPRQYFVQFVEYDQNDSGNWD